MKGSDLAPPDPRAACAVLGIEPGKHPPGATFSGGRLEDFAGGWARLCFRGRSGHWWREVKLDVPVIHNGSRVRFYASTCGLIGEATYHTPMFGVGTMPVCKLCLRKHKHPTAAERMTFVDLAG